MCRRYHFTEDDMAYYEYPQETWSEKECAKRSRAGSRDYFGTKQRPGLIASSSSTCAQYGQTQRYNGGCLRDGKHWEGETRPLPIVPEGWKFEYVPTWGTYLVKKKHHA